MRLRLEDGEVETLGLGDQKVLQGYDALVAPNPARKVSLLTGHPLQFLLKEFIREKSRILNIKLREINMNSNAHFILVQGVVDYLVALWHLSR